MTVLEHGQTVPKEEVDAWLKKVQEASAEKTKLILRKNIKVGCDLVYLRIQNDNATKIEGVRSRLDYGMKISNMRGYGLKTTLPAKAFIDIPLSDFTNGDGERYDGRKRRPIVSLFYEGDKEPQLFEP